MKHAAVVAAGSVLGTVALLAGGAWVYAQATDGVINACVKKDGSTRILLPGITSSTCNKGEQLVTWNIMGPQGPKGDKGEQGVQGEPGAPGRDYNTPPPSSTVDFAINRPVPFNGDWVEIPPGYTQMVIDLSITGWISDYGIQFTNDSNSAEGIQQQGVQCNSQSTCPPVTLPILGKYYRISTGTAQGNATSHGYLSSLALTHGAGNIRFTWSNYGSGATTDDYRYTLAVLLQDGTTWWMKYNPNLPNGGTWSIDTGGVTLPIPIDNIIDWSPWMILDKGGHVWQHFGSGWAEPQGLP